MHSSKKLWIAISILGFLLVISLLISSNLSLSVISLRRDLKKQEKKIGFVSPGADLEDQIVDVEDEVSDMEARIDSVANKADDFRREINAIGDGVIEAHGQLGGIDSRLNNLRNIFNDNVDTANENDEELGQCLEKLGFFIYLSDLSTY